MDLDQNRHAHRFGTCLHCRQTRGIERGDDEQDAIGADSARLGHLIFVDQKILAQRRQCTCIPCGGEIVRRALEIFAIGEHGQACGTAGLVSPRDRRGIEDRAQHPLARTCFFDLCDDSRLSGGYPAPECPDKVPRWR